jgi:hypothetical protein
VYERIPEETVKKYWHGVTKAKRRYPGSKDKKVMMHTLNTILKKWINFS